MNQENKNKVINFFQELLSSDKSEETVEVKFEMIKVADQDVSFEAEVFEEGNEVFVVSGEERIPVPVGEYSLEDGRVLVVEEEGVIASVGEISDEAEEPVEEEQEMKEDSQPKKVVESVSKELHFSTEDLKQLFKDWYEEFTKSNELKEVVELSESVPVAKPIKHSPEKNTEKKVVVLSKRKRMTTADRILQKQLNRL